MNGIAIRHVISVPRPVPVLIITLSALFHDHARRAW